MVDDRKYNDEKGAPAGVPLLHQHEKQEDQEDIESQIVKPSLDILNAANTNPASAPPPSPDKRYSRPLTPFVLQMELSDRKRHKSSHSKSDKDEEQDMVDLAPSAMAPLTSNNQFTAREIVSQGLIDVALMMANISQLRTLITAGSEVEHYDFLLSLVIFSLVAQIIFAVVIFIIYMREAEDHHKEEFRALLRQGDIELGSVAESINVYKLRMEQRFRRRQLTNRLNFVTIVLVFLITLINMFITGFGIKLGKDGIGLDASILDDGREAMNITVRAVTLDLRNESFPVFLNKSNGA